MLQNHNPQDARVRWGDTVVEYDFDYEPSRWPAVALAIGAIVAVAMFVVAAFI